MSAIVANTGTNYTLYYNLLNYFKTIMSNHPSIMAVTQGDISTIDVEAYPIYPFGNILVTESTFGFNTTNFTVQLTIADKIKNKNNTSAVRTNAQTIPFYNIDDTVDIHSNTLAILNDLTAYTQRGVAGFEINGDITCTPFADQFNNGLAGWVSTFTLTTHNNKNRCLFFLVDPSGSGYKIQNCSTSESYYAVLSTTASIGTTFSSTYPTFPTCYTVLSSVTDFDDWNLVNLIPQATFTSCVSCSNATDKWQIQACEDNTIQSVTFNTTSSLTTGSIVGVNSQYTASLGSRCWTLISKTGSATYNAITLASATYTSCDDCFGTSSVNYLLVGGGGAAGQANLNLRESGAGGAGGVISGSITVRNNNNYIITIASGGVATNSTASNGANGENTSITGTIVSLIAYGGGGGATNSNSTSSITVASTGASGGGGGTSSGPNQQGGVLQITPRQGNSGSYGDASKSGGGGGASQAAGAIRVEQGGSGSYVSYAATLGYGFPAGHFGGGGSGVDGVGPVGGQILGGQGGGGNGADTTGNVVSNHTGSSGKANTGGGGGGSMVGTGSIPSAANIGGSGGSGIVILSYIGSVMGTGGVISTTGGSTYHTFLSSSIFVKT